MNWKHLFKPQILERGAEYYYEGAVDNLDCEANIISAIVYGSEDYHVEIALDNNNVAAMHCSCPYADDGNNCKHMAAVLMEYETQPEKTDRISVRELVDGADEKTVKSFLIDLLKGDSLLAERFRIIARKNTAEFHEREFKYCIEKIIHIHSDRYGYINYRSAYSFYEALNDLFHSTVNTLVEAENYKAVFYAIMYMCDGLSGIEIDDSDGILNMLTDTLEDIFADVSENSSIEEKQEFFSLLKEKAKSNGDWFITDFLENLMLYGFPEEEFYEDRLKFVEEKIQFYENNNESSDYYIENWITLYLQMLPEERIKSVCSKYENYPQIRKWYAEKCIAEENYDEAISTLTEGINQSDNKWTAHNFRCRLKELYRVTGAHKEYRKTLTEIVLYEGGRNLQAFRELKNLYTPEDWKKIRDDILSGVPSWDIHILYNEEKLYSKLLQCALSGHGLNLIKKYQKILSEYFPEKVIEKYVSELTKQVSFANNRNMYKAIVCELKELATFPKGKEAAEKLAEQWRIAYKRRTAMMEELKKF